RRAQRRLSGAVAATVHSVVLGRRLPPRARILRRTGCAALQRVQQNRVRPRPPLAFRPGADASDWADVGRQRRICPVARLLSRGYPMAGNSALRTRLHHHFRDAIVYSGQIGLTHRSFSPDEPKLPGAKPAWFFAPDQIRKRAREWGPGGIEKKFGAAWVGFAPNLDNWLTIVDGRGREAVQRVYLDTLQGRIPPAQGHMLSLLA